MSMFFLNMFVIYVYDQDAAGEALLFLNTAMLLGYLFCFGIQKKALKDFNCNLDNTKEKVRVLYNSLSTYLVICGIFLVIFVLLSNLDIINDTSYRFINTIEHIISLYISSASYGLILITAHLYQSINKYKSSLILLNISVPGLIAFSLFIGAKSQTLEFPIILMCALLIVSLIGLFVFIKSQIGSDIYLKFQIYSKDNFIQIFNFAVLAILDVAFILGGNVIAASTIEISEVAGFTISQRLANLIALILMAVNLIYLPQFISLNKQSNYAEIKKLYMSTLKFSCISGLLIYIGVTIFSFEILKTFGAEYAQYKGVLEIFLLGQLINVMLGPAPQVLAMCGKESTIKYIGLLSITLLFVLTYIGGSAYGIIGASIAINLSLVFYKSFSIVTLYIYLSRVKMT